MKDGPADNVKSRKEQNLPHLSNDFAERGLTTISPPAKVKPGVPELPQVLCHGIDTLYLNIDVKWESSEFFEKLTSSKNNAQESHSDYSISLYLAGYGQSWRCLVKPHGARGYEWILEGAEFTMRIGNWLDPIQKPSIVAELRSEALWRLGPKNVLKRLLHILKGQGAKVVAIKPGRVDLCVDLLIDDSFWRMDLINYRVTRAAYAAPHFDRNTLTGLSIGKGNISARIYDKPFEIKKQSGKVWMYDIWGIDEVPDEKRVLRVEFQIRREVITQLGVDKVGHLFRSLENIWAYCTRKWLKFQSNPGKHHTQRKTFPWWEIVQQGFGRIQNAEPSIRFKSYSPIEDQIMRQIYGLFTTLEAMNVGYCSSILDLADIDVSYSIFKRSINNLGKDKFAFQNDVEDKVAKFIQTDLDMIKAHEERNRKILPSNTQTYQLEKAKKIQQCLGFKTKQEG